MEELKNKWFVIFDKNLSRFRVVNEYRGCFDFVESAKWKWSASLKDKTGLVQLTDDPTKAMCFDRAQTARKRLSSLFTNPNLFDVKKDEKDND